MNEYQPRSTLLKNEKDIFSDGEFPPEMIRPYFDIGKAVNTMMKNKEDRERKRKRMINIILWVSWYTAAIACACYVISLI